MSIDIFEVGLNRLDKWSEQAVRKFLNITLVYRVFMRIQQIFLLKFSRIFCFGLKNIASMYCASCVYCVITKLNLSTRRLEYIMNS